MNYECPTELQTLLDLVDLTVNYNLGEIRVTGKSLDEIAKALRYRLNLPKWIGVGRCRAISLPAEFCRWVWTGEIVPLPLVEKGKTQWILNGRPPTESEIDDALKTDAFLRCGEWQTELFLDGKPATRDEIDQAKKKYNEYPKTDIEGALRRYNMIRVARQVLQTIVDLSENPDPKRSIDGIKLVQGHGEYRIRIIGTRYDPELKEALNGHAARIRKCGAIRCLKFFWFGRSDQKGCNKKHGAANRKARSPARKRSAMV